MPENKTSFYTGAEYRTCKGIINILEFAHNESKKVLRILFNIVFWGFTLGIAALAVLVFIYGNDLPDYKKLATYAPPVATRLYASDGSLLIEYAEDVVSLLILLICRHSW